ncbi:MAG: LysR family transcriptional regulator [Oscillospiraceae bacterium]|nr:LysR family transcriptional regulator [Oscillospiraceae bacterium]MBQ4539492.1 LysR family transcriptional regulator [Oscillospiraceae bacterium]
MVTLQQLKYFRELAKTCHLTRTAERLYITQTTLSNTIINLENQIGIKLFNRVGRNIQLSDAGKQYYKYVNEALIALENAQTAIDDFKENDRQNISVAMNSSNVWNEMIHGFRNKYRSYNLRQIDCDKALFYQMLINQEIDFVLAGNGDIPMKGLKYHFLRNEILYLCVSKDNPLANRESIYLADAKDESFVTLPHTSCFSGFCDKLFHKAGINYKVAVECDYTLRGKLVEAGLGAAITTSISRNRSMLGENIAYIPIIDDFARRPISIIWNPQHYLSRAARDFRDYVIETIV